MESVSRHQAAIKRTIDPHVKAVIGALVAHDLARPADNRWLQYFRAKKFVSHLCGWEAGRFGNCCLEGQYDLAIAEYLRGIEL
jgi:hypothetical protein